MTLINQAQIAVTNLLKADEDQLYEQLGIRSKAIQQDLSKSALFDPDVIYDSAQMGVKDDVRELGRRIFNRWHRECFNLMCGSAVEDVEQRRDLVNAVGIGETEVATTLTAVLVAHFGVAPAIAAVLGALIVKRFFRPAYEEFCEVWRKNLP